MTDVRTEWLLRGGQTVTTTKLTPLECAEAFEKAIKLSEYDEHAYNCIGDENLLAAAHYLRCLSDPRTVRVPRRFDFPEIQEGKWRRAVALGESLVAIWDEERSK